MPQTIHLPQPKEHTLTLDGYDFGCRFYKGFDQDAPPTMFISGAFQNFSSWNRFAEKFWLEGKSVIVLNLPGTGDCTPLPPSYGVDFLAHSIRQALDLLEYDLVSIVAASYSTPTAYYYASKYPDTLNNLCLCGTMQDVPPHLRRYVWMSIEALREGRMEEFANGVLGVTGPCQGYGMMCTDPTKTISKRRLVHKILYSQLQGMSHDNRQRYETNTLRLLLSEGIDLSKPPKCNTLVFTGEHDTFTRPDYCMSIAKAIPKAVFTTIDEADHFFHLEQFPTTSELLYKFSYGLDISSITGISQPVQPRNVGRCTSQPSLTRRLPTKTLLPNPSGLPPQLRVA